MAAAARLVSAEFPGRGLSINAWTPHKGYVDNLFIITTGEIQGPTDSEEERGIYDPSMPPDAQIAVSGYVDIFAFEDDPAAVHGGITGRPMPLESGSAEDFALIRRWIETCTTRHAKCSSARQTRLPDRVVDVGPPDGLTEPRLVENITATAGTYVTLSHCWGGEQPLITTSDSLQAHKHQIPMARLPRTFHEAVIVTRQLGYRYLWIDSLCILQDSASDWASQAAKMADIYSGCVIALAARAAKNAGAGLFLSRPPPAASCSMRYTTDDGRQVGTYYVRDPAFQHEVAWDTPLERRRWTLQERLLPPRVVHFGSQQLYWECNETEQRQDGKAPAVSLTHVVRNLAWKSKLTVRSLDGAHDAGSPQTSWLPFSIWYEILEEYSTRDIRFVSDILPAISGLARAFAAQHRLTYAAGIFLEDVGPGLSWYLRRPGDRDVVDVDLPTWSWARFAGRLGFFHLTTHSKTDCHCIHKDYTFTAKGQNEFAAVRNAELALEGRVISVSYSKGKYCSQGAEEEFDVWTTSRNPIGKMALDHDLEYWPPQKLACLLLHDRGTVGHALLLQEVSRDEPARFRRIGFVRISAYRYDPYVKFRRPVLCKTIFPTNTTRSIVLV